jgi:hypothetical protein
VTAEIRWARIYRDDPVTAELLKRGVIIPFHEDLHKAADAFIYGTIKNSIGEENSERLGLHHYATHVKLGLAQEHLADLKKTLADGNFDLDTGPQLVFGKLLTGFFVNLLAVFDNLTQEISLIYGLELDRKSSIPRLFQMLRDSKKRKELNKIAPIDRRLSKLPSILADPNTTKTIETIGAYRNYITHSRLPAAETSVKASATFTATLDIDRSQTPGRTVTSTASGAVRFPSREPRPGSAGSDVGLFHSYKEEKDLVPSTKPKIGKFVVSAEPPGFGKPRTQEIDILQEGSGRLRLPKADRLDILPSRMKETDLDPDDITVVCDKFYLWTVEFLGKVYQQLTDEFKRLI